MIFNFRLYILTEIKINLSYFIKILRIKTVKKCKINMIKNITKQTNPTFEILLNILKIL